MEDHNAIQDKAKNNMTCDGDRVKSGQEQKRFVSRRVFSNQVLVPP